MVFFYSIIREGISIIVVSILTLENAWSKVPILDSFRLFEIAGMTLKMIVLRDKE